MKFYKITKELDQKNVKGTFLVGGELLTEKEAIKFDCLELLKNKAEKVNISKFKTHWCFGTRRANTINIMNTIEKDIIIAEFIEMQKTDIGWFDNEGILSQHIYDETGGNIIAVEDVPKEETYKYGIVDVESEDGNSLPVRGLVEKPAIEEAPSTLSVIGRYILQPEVHE